MTQYVQEKVANLERPWVAWALLGVAIALMCLYAFYVNAAVSNVVKAKELGIKISALTSSVGELETNYLAKKSSIDLSVALSMGYSQAESDAIYIAKGTVASLSINR